MRVIVSRSGGIAGMRMTWQVRIEDQPDASDWFALLRALPWDQVDHQAVRPDRFVYRIRFEKPADPEPDGDGRTSADDAPGLPAEAEATLAEQQLKGPWRELVDRVRAVGGPRSAGSRTSAPTPAPAGGSA
jgi:hypothetical protein